MISEEIKIYKLKSGSKKKKFESFKAKEEQIRINEAKKQV
jgi:hypothetical protein